MALDILEEYMGLKTRLEAVANTNHIRVATLDPRSSGGHIGGLDKAQALGGAGGSGSYGGTGGVGGVGGLSGNSSNSGGGGGGVGVGVGGGNGESGWVADVGVGKDWDKVGGYWRFSDLLRLGDLGFVNSGSPGVTGTPGARGAILDLSKYVCPLEIFGGCSATSKVK